MIRIGKMSQPPSSFGRVCRHTSASIFRHQRRDAATLEARRLVALQWLQSGKPPVYIARCLGVSRQAVHIWANQYREGGTAGLLQHPRPGRPPKLALAKLAELLRLLERGAQAFGFITDAWTGQRVAELIQRRFGVHYKPWSGCLLLRRLGWRRGSPRKAHALVFAGESDLPLLPAPSQNPGVAMGRTPLS